MAILMLIIGLAYSTGPANNGVYYTGGPSAGGGTESTCFDCHRSGESNYGEPQVNWTISATDGGPNVSTYVPGETYFITVSVTPEMGTPAGFGFQSIFLKTTDNTQAGSHSGFDANTQGSADGTGRTYVEHNKRTPSGTWSFQWTAPNQGTGSVDIYSVGNSVNGANGTGGDSGSKATTKITLTEAAMPVDLTAFEAVAEKATVKLHWSTATEDNASHFEVERSTDGESFAPIGRVDAVGNIGRNQDYAFTDLEAPAGIQYYRLHMVDLDESFAFSQVAQVRVEAVGALRVYPNPAQTTVFIDGKMTESTKVRILDGTGRTLLTRKGAGLIDISDLHTGIYLVETMREGTREVKKLIKQ